MTNIEINLRHFSPVIVNVLRYLRDNGETYGGQIARSDAKHRACVYGQAFLRLRKLGLVSIRRARYPGAAGLPPVFYSLTERGRQALVHIEGLEAILQGVKSTKEAAE